MDSVEGFLNQRKGGQRLRLRLKEQKHVAWGREAVGNV